MPGKACSAASCHRTARNVERPATDQLSPPTLLEALSASQKRRRTKPSGALESYCPSAFIRSGEPLAVPADRIAHQSIIRPHSIASGDERSDKDALEYYCSSAFIRSGEPLAVPADRIAHQSIIRPHSIASGDERSDKDALEYYCSSAFIRSGEPLAVPADRIALELRRHDRLDQAAACTGQSLMVRAPSRTETRTVSPSRTPPARICSASGSCTFF